MLWAGWKSIPEGKVHEYRENELYERYVHKEGRLCLSKDLWQEVCYKRQSSRFSIACSAHSISNGNRQCSLDINE